MTASDGRHLTQRGTWSWRWGRSVTTIVTHLSLPPFHVPMPPTPFDSCGVGPITQSACYNRIITEPAASLGLQFILYGAYAVLYGVCLFTLTSRNLPHYRIHVVAATALFAVATVSLGLNSTIVIRTATLALTPVAFNHDSIPYDTRNTVADILDQQRVYIPTAHMLLVFANSIADAILVWRCYTIWAHNKKVTVFPALFCFANNLLGIITSAMYICNRHVEQFFQIPHVDPTSTFFTIFIFGTLLSNVLITAMIAGRITYLAYQSKAFLVPCYWKLYRTAISITLESGMLLPLAIVVYSVAALRSQRHPNIQDDLMPPEKAATMETIAEVMFYALVQFVGIAPTLIIARIGLGVSVEDKEEEKYEMRMA
ncbi:hypothetical protein L218DRAFT_990849 [Marasmius fiardii PR-910]|nr:hypothetical protein L218DRAFT_990849 [Marasmius fiardii PR-910]